MIISTCQIFLQQQQQQRQKQFLLRNCARNKRGGCGDASVGSVGGMRTATSYHSNARPKDMIASELCKVIIVHPPMH
jgi:hypothetical protein